MSEFTEFHDSQDETKSILSSSRSSLRSTKSEDQRSSVSKNAIRFVMLCLQYYILGATHFCVNLPSGLETVIIKVTGIDVMKYNAIFSAYAWPDVLMPIIGGMIVDRVVGMRCGYLIFTSILMIGQGVMTVGGYLGMFWVMLLGRIIFGCGVGIMMSLVAGSQVLLYDSNTALIISLNIGFTRICAGVALFISHRIYTNFGFLPTSHHQLGATFGVGFVLTIGVLLSAIAIALLDKLIIKRLVKERKKSRAKPSVNSLFNFSFSYWLLVLIGGLFYPVVFSLVGNGQFFFVAKYGMKINEAGLVNSINFAGAVFLSPFLAIVIGLYRYHSLWIMAGVLLGISSHVIFISVTSFDNKTLVYTAAVLISLAYSFIVCSQWPLIGEIVNPDQLTTAFGIAMAFDDLVYSVLSVAQGMIIDYYGFFIYELMNAQVLWMAVLIVVLLLIEEISLRTQNKARAIVKRRR